MLHVHIILCVIQQRIYWEFCILKKGLAFLRMQLRNLLFMIQILIYTLGYGLMFESSRKCWISPTCSALKNQWALVFILCKCSWHRLWGCFTHLTDCIISKVWIHLKRFFFCKRCLFLLLSKTKDKPSLVMCDSSIVHDWASSRFAWLTCLRVIVWSGVCSTSLIQALSCMVACSAPFYTLSLCEWKLCEIRVTKKAFYINLSCSISQDAGFYESWCEFKWESMYTE